MAVHAKVVFNMVLLIFLALAPNILQAEEAQFSWQPNGESNLEGYMIHYGTESRKYIEEVDLGLPNIVGGRVQGVVTGLAPGETYYFVATAYDSGGDESGYSQEVTYTVPRSPSAPSTASPSEHPFTLELGEVDINHALVRVNFVQSFVNPVVVAKMVSKNGSDPCVVRIQGVDQTGFTLRIQEYDYLDGAHTKESVSYLVMEAGSFTLDDGTLVEAGFFKSAATTSYDYHPYFQPFSTTPVVLTSVTSANEKVAVVGRVSNISVSGFDYLLQEQEKNGKVHPMERIDYIAWEPGRGQYENLEFEVGVTANTITHKVAAVSYEKSFTVLPIQLTEMQTKNGGDTSRMAARSVTRSGMELFVEEEKSKDTEVSHTREKAGYLAIDAR